MTRPARTVLHAWHTCSSLPSKLIGFTLLAVYQCDVGRNIALRFVLPCELQLTILILLVALSRALARFNTATQRTYFFISLFYFQYPSVIQYKEFNFSLTAPSEREIIAIKELALVYKELLLHTLLLPAKRQTTYTGTLWRDMHACD